MCADWSQTDGNRQFIFYEHFLSWGFEQVKILYIWWILEKRQEIRINKSTKW